jgi:DNA processing protein
MLYLEDSLYLHGLNLMPQFGPARLSLLAKTFKNFKYAYEASAKELIQAGIAKEIVEDFVLKRASINLSNEAEKLQADQITLLSFKDTHYPKLLLEIPKFPPILYYKGLMNSSDELCISVVGTRMITNYGKSVLPQLVEPLVDSGITIVSGMAFGTDALAHEMAVRKGKRTIAILGGGLDEKSLYPKHHGLLAQEILDNGGALISEYPIGTPNFKQNFVARNRIISGMSVGTIIIECDLKSGTLITAKHALDQNRTIYSVPGPIYSPQSQGPNNLLKMGAKPITLANDVLEDLNLKTFPEQLKMQNTFGDNKEETIVLKLLSFEPIIINDLIKSSGLGTSVVTSTLTFLEIKGRIKNLGGQQYVLAR